MEVRLAHEAGLLRGPDRNRCQRWASIYVLLVIQRDDRNKREDSLVRQMTLALAPDRFAAMYMGADPSRIGLADGEENIAADEISAAYAFVQKLDEQRSLMASDVPEGDIWSEWV